MYHWTCSCRRQFRVSGKWPVTSNTLAFFSYSPPSLIPFFLYFLNPICLDLTCTILCTNKTNVIARRSVIFHFFPTFNLTSNSRKGREKKRKEPKKKWNLVFFFVFFLNPKLYHKKFPSLLHGWLWKLIFLFW